MDHASRDISRIKYTIKALENFPIKISLFHLRSFTDISVLQKTHGLKSNSDKTRKRHMPVKSRAAGDPRSATNHKSPSRGVMDPETTGFSLSHRTGTFLGHRCPLCPEAMLARASKQLSCQACADCATERHYLLLMS